MISGHARAGRKSQRFELRHGDCGGNKYWDDCTSDRLRIERKEHPKNRMQKVGEQVWYGWSFFLDASFRDIGPGNTLLGQMKMKGWRLPIWQFNMREGKALMWFGEGGGRTVGHVSTMRGAWQDVVIFADYCLSPKGPSFVMYLNGKQVCSIRKPLVNSHMLTASDKLLYMKYGVNSSYVSRWLERTKTRSVTARQFNDSYASTAGGTKNSASASSTPFAYDWGVELPTQIVIL